MKQLMKLEGEITNLNFPASGSLYLRGSMGDDDTYEVLDRNADPSGQFCIKPSSERGWHAQGRLSAVQSCFRTNSSSYGLALVEREMKCIQQTPAPANSDPPRGSFEDHISILHMAKEVISRLDADTLLDEVSQPVLWHTDLHMGNVYVSDKEPTKIVSLIDWQSIVVSSLFLQARLPIFLPIEEEYDFSMRNLPKLSQNYPEIDAEDKLYPEHKFREARLGKIYELNSGSENHLGYKGLQLPSIIREFFLRAGEVSEEGIIPLRACLIEFVYSWNELGFKGPCPFSFSDDDLQQHERQFQKYRDYHNSHKPAMKTLDHRPGFRSETDLRLWR